MADLITLIRAKAIKDHLQRALDQMLIAAKIKVPGHQIAEIESADLNHETMSITVKYHFRDRPSVLDYEGDPR